MYQFQALTHHLTSAGAADSEPSSKDGEANHHFLAIESNEGAGSTVLLETSNMQSLSELVTRRHGPTPLL